MIFYQLKSKPILIHLGLRDERNKPLKRASIDALGHEVLFTYNIYVT